MKELLKVLCLEDSPQDAEIMRELLIDAGYNLNMDCTASEKEYVSLLRSHKYDLILADFKLPGFDGFAALQWSVEICPDVPFICISGTIGEETAVELLKEGAVDYILKDRLIRLPSAIQRAIEQHSIQIEKRAVELLLKENEEKLQSIFSAAPIGIGLVVGRIFIELNDTFCRMTGYNRMELIGKDAETIYAKDEQNESAGFVIYRHIAEKGIGSVETRFKCKDGRVLNIFLSSTPLDKDDLSKGVTFIALNITERKLAEEKLIIANRELVFQSKEKEKRAGELLIANKELAFQITERKQAEDALRESEEGYRKLFENHSAVKIILDPDTGAILDANDAAAQYYGWTHEELKHMKIYQINTLSHEEVDVEMERARSKRRNRFEFRHRRADGSIRDVEVFSSKIEIRGKDVLNSIIQDITERKQVEEELKNKMDELTIANKAILQSEKNFHRSISKSPMGIRIVSADGETIYANKAFLAIFELNSLEEFASIPTINLYTPESYAQHQKRKEKRKNGHDVFDYEISIICANAGIRYIKIWRREVLWNGTKHYQVINLDITEQKKLTIDLIAAKEKAEESDRLKSAFLTNMSHEIRTPMNGILGFTELLKEPNLSSDDLQDYIKTIQISGARMLNTINSIVDISKIESGLMNVDIKETNINEKMEFTYNFFKPEVEIKGLQFLFKNGLSSKEAVIKTDNEKVYGILTNLVKNAIKFTYEGSIEFGYEKKGKYLEFFVKDTGVGIPKNQMELIFERFRQGSESHNRGYEGSGLGLSIAKSYVEMLGGKIWVESEEGKGSTFYFTIPYNAVSEEKRAIENVVSAEHKEVQVKNLKILIVEDDEISYSLLTRMLQKISKEVLHAITGVQAVEACRNNPDLDLVLMDIRMPKMDGSEATRQIRQFNTDVIIIAQTAYAFSGDKEKAIEAGCNDYISKPINYALLYELIKKHINK